MEITLPDVLTLEETLAYLRLPVETILRQALEGNIPGRRIGEDWRFLKIAVDNWLSSRSNRSILLQQAGALADDETLVELRARPE